MKVAKLIFKLFLFSLVFVSCSDDDNSGLSLDIRANDILISGQGSGAGSGSVSYISSDYSEIENAIFARINGEQQLGVYLQSLAFSDTNAYVVVDNTNTITVVNKVSFKEESKITDQLEGPKFMTVVGDKGYVTNYGESDSFVAVVDLTTNKVTSKINVAKGPEKIIEKDGKLYMTHTYSNALVTVVDIATETVETIVVDDNPNDLFFNSSNELIVLSQGGTQYNPDWSVAGYTKGSIQVINVTTKTITKQLDFVPGVQPNILREYNGKLYYHLSGGVYELSYTDAALPTTPLLGATLSGMAISNGKLYGVNAGFYTELSEFYVYDLTTKVKEQEFEVALGATQIYIVE